MSEIIGLLLRHVLTGVGAALISHGVNATDAQTLIGAISVLGGLVWSYIQKRQAAKAAQ
jgi:hypothetical protein